jgi:hypothetical protein
MKHCNEQLFNMPSVTVGYWHRYIPLASVGMLFDEGLLKKSFLFLCDGAGIATRLSECRMSFTFEPSTNI